MSSKIIRRKRPQVAKDENLERIKAYQKVDGFTRCPVAPDGNCFYTATGFFCGLNAAEMRELVMKYFIFKKAEYSIFFETEREFMTAVKTNSSPRVWNSELCDIAPHAAAQALRRDVIIHNYDGKNINQIVTPSENPLYPPLNLFRSNDHYEILLDNNKKPNKNIWPLPDVSEFMDVIDLTFSDDEEEKEEIEPDIEEDEPCEDEDECMIRM
jgi:hypothetical protein